MTQSEGYHFRSAIVRMTKECSDFNFRHRFLKACVVQPSPVFQGSAGSQKWVPVPSAAVTGRTRSSIAEKPKASLGRRVDNLQQTLPRAAPHGGDISKPPKARQRTLKPDYQSASGFSREKILPVTSDGVCVRSDLQRKCVQCNWLGDDLPGPE